MQQEDSRLRRKIEVDPTLKGKAKEAFKAARSPVFQPIEEESEYNPTPHTFTTTQQTPIPSTHPTHFPSTQPGHTAAPTPAATLPTTQIPYNIPTILHTTHVPPYNPQYLSTTHIPPHNLTSTFPAMINHPIPPYLLPPHQPRRRHPFTDFIANTPLPAQWEPFTLDRYIGETDPDKYLKVYITHVALYTSQDAVFCKAFQDKIEELVCVGHFRRFIRRDDHPSRSRHPLDLTTDALHMTPVTTDAPPNPPTKNPNRPAPTSPLPTLPYVAPSTPSLVASVVEDPLLLPERDTSAISNPLTISPIPTTNAACLPSSS